jgi:threonine dehydrogenase-like Zn-dependent dehydrogenase
MVPQCGSAETINFDEEHVYERLLELTNGLGPDSCIDAVGCEAHSHGSIDAVLDKAKKTLKPGTDRAHVLREVLYCCRKGGTVTIPGVYVGLVDKLPFGAAMKGAHTQDGTDARAEVRENAAQAH